jgi:hypothetical protein
MIRSLGSGALCAVCAITVAAVAAGSVLADPLNPKSADRAQPPQPAAAPPTLVDQTNRSAQLLQLTAPNGLTSTQDVQTCTQFGGFGAGLACKALLPKNRLVLIWNYTPDRNPVTGFHIYRVDKGFSSPVGSQANGPAVRFYIVDPPPAGGYTGVCYTVSAYGGGKESAPTAPFCVAPSAVSKTATLQATQVRTAVQDSEGRPVGNGGFAPLALSVGYNETYTTQSVVVQIGSYSDDEVYRAGLLFDLSSLAYKKIHSATLHLSVDSAWVWSGSTPVLPTANTVTDHYNSCAANVSVGVDRWWEHSDWINDNKALSPGPANGPDVTIDVTSIVANWAAGQPNFGFVLEGTNESMTIHSNAGCVTSYVPASATLVVQYD